MNNFFEIDLQNVFQKYKFWFFRMFLRSHGMTIKLTGILGVLKLVEKRRKYHSQGLHGPPRNVL